MTRTRRPPAATRAHIIDVAAEVFTEKLPDAVGLRELAAAAGISHGLVTHYFQSYENLVNEVIAARLGALRESAFAHLAAATFAPDESPLLDVLLDLREDRALVRLLLWAVLSGRTELVTAATGQLGRIVDMMHARLAGLGTKLPRERIEFSVAAAIALVVGWSAAGTVLEHNLGRPDRPYTREELRAEIRRMLRAYVVAA